MNEKLRIKSEKWPILVHCAIWLVIFLSPLSFMHRGEEIDYLHYFMMCVGPVALMIVFYTNYLWLTPRYFMRHERLIYWVVNVVMISLLAVIVHYWLNNVDNFLADGGRPHHHHLTPLKTMLFLLRHVFNLAVAAAIATTIQLAMGWRSSEEARLKAEAAKTEAELRNLRSQINPHFLLNTLNNIYALTAINQERAQDAIQQLSKMLRHMLYDNQESEVALQDEVTFLENYVNLMKLRLPASVDVSFHQDIQNPQAKIAPLLFISLVENAFKHGISPVDACFVHISLSQQAATICFAISNSNHPKTEQDHSGHGIGLQQVQRRLDLAYPGHYEWTKGTSADGKVYESNIRITL